MIFFRFRRILNLQLLFFFFLFFLLPVTAVCRDWIYTVQPGDNAWNLGEKYLKTMQNQQQFIALNNIADPLHIAPGTRLRFPLSWLKSGATMATVLYVHGEVMVVQAKTGLQTAATPGMFLWAKDEIHTGGGGNVTLQFADGSKVLLQQESTLAIESLMKYGQTGMADSRLHLKKGKTDNKIKPKTGPGSRFEIRTPSALATVRGTMYRVSTDQDQMQTEVSRGEVNVENARAKQSVPAPYGTLVKKAQKPLKPVPLLSPPDLSSLPEVLEEAPFMLRFPKIKGAVAYRLQVATDQNFNILLADNISDKPRILVPELADGDYVLRLRGIDDKGLEGLNALHWCTLNARPLPPIRIEPRDGAVITNPRPGFRWSAPKLASSYSFQLADNDRFEEPLINRQEYNKTTIQPDSDLPPGIYYWRVAGRDASGELGPLGMTMQFRIPVPAPDMEQSVFDAEEMVFRWQEVGPEQRYRVQFSTDESFIKIITDKQTDRAEYKMSPLEPGEYFIRVATIEPDDFQGPFSTPQHFIVPSAPNPWALLIPLGFILILVL